MLTTRNIRRRNMKILMVLTSHDVLGNTGRKTGFWLEEFTAPYFVFRDAGVQLTLASPKGGQPLRRLLPKRSSMLTVFDCECHR
jgi:putative intracellular protease/amidase